MTYTQIYNFFTQTYTSAYTHTNILLNLSTVIFTYKQIYTFIYTFIIICMNTHYFIHKIFILSFLSNIHSDNKITFLNTRKQIYGLVLIETYIVTHVYKKIKTSFPHHTVHLQNFVNKNCFWLLFYLFQTISETELFRSYLAEQNEVHKNHFWVLFHSAKSISDHFRTLKTFEKFSKNFLKFLFFDPCTA